MENSTIAKIKNGDYVLYHADYGGRTMLSVSVPARVVGLSDDNIECYVPMLGKNMSFERATGVATSGRVDGFIEGM